MAYLPPPRLRAWAIAAILGSASLQAADDAFDLQRIRVTGNTLLPASQLEDVVARHIGRGKTFRDIQHALEALEAAYRNAGFGAVQVSIPEQELTSGTLLLAVEEIPIATVTVKGNQHFDQANIRATLPSLREGSSPNTRQLSENIQLANENPARQLDVVLGVGQAPGTLDAAISVTDEAPLRAYLTADNTGTPTSGRHRAGVSLRHANLFNRDHTATFSYTGSPDMPQGSRVDIFSLGYRIPLYGIGDSIDLFYAKSSTNTPASTLSVGGTLGLTGRGDMIGMRWNHYFARQGEYTSKLVGGWDIKLMDTTCSSDGTPVPFGVSAGCTPYTTRPLSLAYSGQWLSSGMATDFQVGYAYNLPTGARYTTTTSAGLTVNDRYSLVASNRSTPENFSALRYSASLSKALVDEWMVRVAFSGQSSLGMALVPAEQIGLAGAQTVRGFHERVVAADSGYVINLELHAPNLAGHLGLPGNLRPLAFYDASRGWNYRMPAGTGVGTQIVGVDSIGMGLRYDLKKDVIARFDLANVLHANGVAQLGGASNTLDHEWRGHFNVTLGF
ncbi:MAG: ShlB/FhaC/HecB family hemolysin secretion/activation protein [Rhodocyclaceae bacterium]